jgi:hypothetical protein
VDGGKDRFDGHLRVGVGRRADNQRWPERPQDFAQVANEVEEIEPVAEIGGGD